MENPHNSQLLRPRGGGLLGLIIGPCYPLQALRLLQKHRSLRPFVLIPLGINILLGMGLYSVGMWWGLKLIDAWMLQLTNWIRPAWLDAIITALSPVIQGGLLIILLIVLGLILLQFGSILGSPFYGQLSEKLEALRTGSSASPEAMGSGAIWRDIWRAILFELKKLLLLLVGGGFILLSGFIPGIGAIVTPIGSLTIAVILLCLDMFDAPLERRRLGFRQKLGLILRCFPASASFGLVCLGLISIPLMNLLAIPLCVSAGTLFFCDRILDTPDQKPS
ncbi:MAG: EI24 domain-containing protein [Cyanobacteria bacterium P01_F01_bin.86]